MNQLTKEYEKNAIFLRKEYEEKLKKLIEKKPEKRFSMASSIINPNKTLISSSFSLNPDHSLINMKNSNRILEEMKKNLSKEVFFIMIFYCNFTIKSQRNIRLLFDKKALKIR